MGIRVYVEEHNKHKLFQTHVDAVAMLVSHTSLITIGLITDINKGGLIFRYIENDINYRKEPKGPCELTISCKAKGFHLDNMHCKVISCQDLPLEFSSGLVPMKKYRIRFEELTSTQASKLEYFIQNFTNFPTWSLSEKTTSDKLCDG